MAACYLSQSENVTCNQATLSISCRSGTGQDIQVDALSLYKDVHSCPIILTWPSGFYLPAFIRILEYQLTWHSFVPLFPTST